jgi:hypothetical protein
LWVSNNTNGCIPLWLLGTEEVTVDLMAHLVANLLSLLIVWVLVFVPSVEAGLVFLVIDLAVSNTANPDLGSEIVLSTDDTETSTAKDHL